MDWPSRTQEGFALAAAAHGDRGAAWAADGIAQDCAERATQVARRLLALPSTERRQWIRDALPGSPIPRAELRGVPARARALLASSVERELGRQWLAAAPLPRAGYAADHELLVVLRRLAARAAR